MRKQILGWIAMAAFPALAGAHGGHVRSHDMEVTTTVTIGVDRIILAHRQVCVGALGRIVWGEIDADGDGRASPDEVSRTAQEMAQQFLKSCPAELDWQALSAPALSPRLSGVPATRPVTIPGDHPLVFELQGVYPARSPPGVHHLRLDLGTLNAYSIVTQAVLEEPVRARGASAGVVSPSGSRVQDMVQIDGQPPALTIVYETEVPGARSSGTPHRVAAALGVLLFALGFMAGRRREPPPT